MGQFNYYRRKVAPGHDPRTAGSYEWTGELADVIGQASDIWDKKQTRDATNAWMKDQVAVDEQQSVLDKDNEDDFYEANSEENFNKGHSIDNYEDKSDKFKEVYGDLTNRGRVSQFKYINSNTARGQTTKAVREGERDMVKAINNTAQKYIKNPLGDASDGIEDIKFVMGRRFPNANKTVMRDMIEKGASQMANAIEGGRLTEAMNNTPTLKVINEKIKMFDDVKKFKAEGDGVSASPGVSHAMKELSKYLTPKELDRYQKGWMRLRDAKKTTDVSAAMSDLNARWKASMPIGSRPKGKDIETMENLTLPFIKENGTPKQYKSAKETVEAIKILDHIEDKIVDGGGSYDYDDALSSMTELKNKFPEKGNVLVKVEEALKGHKAEQARVLSDEGVEGLATFSTEAKVIQQQYEKDGDYGKYSRAMEAVAMKLGVDPGKIDMLPKHIKKGLQVRVTNLKENFSTKTIEEVGSALTKLDKATQGNVAKLAPTLRRMGLTDAQSNMLVSYIKHPDKAFAMQATRSMFYDYNKLWPKDDERRDQLADLMAKSRKKMDGFYQHIRYLDPKNRARLTKIINDTTRSFLADAIDQGLKDLDDPKLQWITGRGDNRYIEQVLKMAGYNRENYVGQGIDGPGIDLPFFGTKIPVYVPPGANKKGVEDFRDAWAKRITENPDRVGFVGESLKNRTKKAKRLVEQLHFKHDPDSKTYTLVGRANNNVRWDGKIIRITEEEFKEGTITNKKDTFVESVIRIGRKVTDPAAKSLSEVNVGLLKGIEAMMTGKGKGKGKGK